ncbi:MAG: nucleotidyltransferase domain-containing protein [Bacteroidales bacterium]|nr:nucleotidyltransferase domain-containing protein [Bacteroidales bacterium]
MTFDDIRKQNLLVYEYIRGSHCHGINTPQSDVDHGGVFLAPVSQILGIGLDYVQQIESPKCDDVWYEMSRFFQLLLKSNPTVLEALFVPDRCVLYESDIMKEIKKHRDIFITKECFNPFGGYAVSQIKKARGLNKKIVNPVNEKLSPIDFCYTFYKQGSGEIKKYLSSRGLKQEYCGLVSINNMHNVYGCYYDFGQQFTDEGITFENLNTFPELSSFIHTIADGGLEKWFEENSAVKNYRGIMDKNTTDTICMSSVSKGENPLFYLYYNAEGYTSHCIKYKEYTDWVKKRNPVRYESNLDKNYDSKNICECFRLVSMCTEIARGEGFKCDRSGIDREFLLDIRAHKFEYDEIMKLLEIKKLEMDSAIAASTIPDKVDADFVNSLLLKIRWQQIKG